MTGKDYLEYQDLRINAIRLKNEIEKLKIENEELKKRLILSEVSRSIGLDTEITLRTMTQEQLDRNINPCELCKYYDRPRDSEDCRKCMDENNYSQYYG